MRPKGPDGLPLKAAHTRVDMVPYREAALFALTGDRRTPCLSMERKLQIINRAVDHVTDGDKPPAWVFEIDHDRPNDRFLPDVWRIVVNACERVKRSHRS